MCIVHEHMNHYILRILSERNNATAQYKSITKNIKYEFTTTTSEFRPIKLKILQQHLFICIQIMHVFSTYLFLSRLPLASLVCFDSILRSMQNRMIVQNRDPTETKQSHTIKIIIISISKQVQTNEIGRSK